MSTERAAPQPLVTLRLGAEGFAGHWDHCAQVANYIATTATEYGPHAAARANLLSTVLNEILEVVHDRVGAHGELRLHLDAVPGGVGVQLDLPATPADRRFYATLVDAVGRVDATQAHLNAIEEGRTDDPAFGMLELAVVHQASLDVCDSDEPGRVRLALRCVPLDTP